MGDQWESDGCRGLRYTPVVEEIGLLPWRNVENGTIHKSHQSDQKQSADSEAVIQEYIPTQKGNVQAQRPNLFVKPRSRSLCTPFTNLAFVPEEVDSDPREEGNIFFPTRKRSVSFNLVEEEAPKPTPSRATSDQYLDELGPNGIAQPRKSISNPDVFLSALRPAIRRSSFTGSVTRLPLPLKRSNSVLSTASTYPELTKEDLLLAATLVEDAVYGRDMQYKEDAKSVMSYRLYHKPVCRWITYVFIWLHLGLVLFESPAIYDLVLPYWATMAVELLCLVAYICRFLHHKHFDVQKNLWANKRYLIVFILVALTWTDMIIFVLWSHFGFGGNHNAIRWSRPLRPIFLAAFGRHLRKAFENINRTLPETLNVLAVFIFVVFMFSLLAFKIFATRNLTYPDGSGYFNDFIDSMWDLYVLVTTANFPDVMMPAYDQNPLYAIFFISYLCICLYIFASILLAVIYNNYKQNLKSDVKKSVLNKRKRLVKAFDIIKVWRERESRYLVNRARWHKLMKIVAPQRSELQRDLLLHVLDDTDDMCLGRGEFLKVADILNVKLSEIKDRSLLLENYCFSCYFSKPSTLVQKMVIHPYFRSVIGVIIVLNSVVMVVDDKIPEIADVLEWTFLAIFLVEIMLKFYVYGCRQFFRRFWNIFDFIVVNAALVARLVDIVLQAADDTNDAKGALAFILIFRILRLMKVMEGIDRFRVVIITVMNIGPSILTYGGVMFIFYYFYAIIGMELFKDKISFHGYVNITDPSKQFCGNPALKGSDFYALQYCKNNFNDIMHSMILLFELTVVNQWHVITAGYVKVTSKAARLYFLAFHMTCVIMILNIFIAFVLEAFILEYSLSNRELISTIEKKIKELGLNTDVDKTPSDIVKLRQNGVVTRRNSLSRQNNNNQSTQGSCLNLEKLEPSHMGSVRRGSIIEQTQEAQLKFHLKKKSRKKMEVLLMYMFENELSDNDLEEDPEEYEAIHPPQLSLETIV